MCGDSGMPCPFLILILINDINKRKQKKIAFLCMCNVSHSKASPCSTYLIITETEINEKRTERASEKGYYHILDSVDNYYFKLSNGMHSFTLIHISLNLN